ncbi:hypothetical protein SEEM841_04843, partial [Salmonella enterica subsp. enterica serovar Senftenberg str. 423984-1]
MPQPGLTTPDNDALPWQTTLLLALQHVLVVAATPTYLRLSDRQ